MIIIAAEGSRATVCLEIDEGNQQVAPIRDKLVAYEVAIGDRPGLHALFAVPTTDCAAWLCRTARWTGPTTVSAWVTTLDERRGRGPGARRAAVPGPSSMPMVLGGPAAGPASLAGPAVGSRRWLELLGSGGAEATPWCEPPG